MTDLWRHKKRGTVYEIITQDASLQCAALPDVELTFEDETFTVYRNVNTGAVYVRPTEEFMDGRFERSPQENAPGHTDLMVTPESIDAFLEANPLPSPQETAE